MFPGFLVRMAKNRLGNYVYAKRYFISVRLYSSSPVTKRYYHFMKQSFLEWPYLYKPHINQSTLTNQLILSYTAKTKFHSGHIHTINFTVFGLG